MKTRTKKKFDISMTVYRALLLLMIILIPIPVEAAENVFVCFRRGLCLNAT